MTETRAHVLYDRGRPFQNRIMFTRRDRRETCENRTSGVLLKTTLEDAKMNLIRRKNDAERERLATRLRADEWWERERKSGFFSPVHYYCVHIMYTRVFYGPFKGLRHVNQRVRVFRHRHRVRPSVSLSLSPVLWTVSMINHH